MNLLQVKCFWAVVTTGSFTEAGEMLHMSQSAVSKKIHALEQELGIQLLNRNGRRFAVSGEGRKMMPHFAELIEGYDQAMMTLDDIKRSGPDHKPVLNIIAVPPVINYGVLPKINYFAREHPEIRVLFDEMGEDRLMLQLQAGEGDLVFCSNLRLDAEHYGMQTHCTEDMVVACSVESALAGAKSITWADLKGRKLIFNRRESSLYDLCVGCCRKAGFEPDVVMTTSRPNIAMEQLAYNPDFFYVGLRASLEPRASDKLPILELSDSPVLNYVFAWKLDQHLSSYAKQFLQYVKK